MESKARKPEPVDPSLVAEIREAARPLPDTDAEIVAMIRSLGADRVRAALPDFRRYRATMPRLQRPLGFLRSLIADPVAFAARHGPPPSTEAEKAVERSRAAEGRAVDDARCRAEAEAQWERLAPAWERYRAEAHRLHVRRIGADAWERDRAAYLAGMNGMLRRLPADERRERGDGMARIELDRRAGVETLDAMIRAGTWWRLGGFAEAA
ncbi:MAG: hypothetical protein KC466_21025 [Myxococcales bacterium]|nr:hypothetical protein [Myxococcales bacterium]